MFDNKIFRVTLITISIFGICIFLFLHFFKYNTNAINDKDVAYIPSSSDSIQDKDDDKLQTTKPSSTSTNIINKTSSGNLFEAPIKTNFMIVGLDQTEALTDVVLIVSFDRNTKKIDVLSVPRDTYIKLTEDTKSNIKKNRGYSVDVLKLNEVHSYIGAKNGINYTKKEVENLLNIKINYTASIKLDAFRKIVDDMGGIYFDVPQRFYYYDPLQNLLIDLKKGEQLLDGKKAEQLVRYRSTYKLGDVQRIKVQQDFMKEFFKQVLNKNVIRDNLFEFISTFISYVKTDFGIGDFPKYMQYIKEIKPENIKFSILPGAGKYVGEVSYFINEPEQTQNLINEIFFSSNENEIDAKNVRIFLLNGTDDNEIQYSKRDELESQGYSNLSIDAYKGQKQKSTRIITRNLKVGQEFSKYFKDVDVKMDNGTMPPEYDIIIIIGTDEVI